MTQNRANKFDLIRSVSKDKYYLNRQFNFLKSLIFFNNNSAKIRLISDLAYYSLTTLLNRQTLGEECYNLILYNSKTHKLQSGLTRALLILFKVVAPFTLNSFISLKIIFLILKKLNQIKFYFSGNKDEFLNLENRFTNSQYLSLNRSKSDDSNTIGFIGILKLMGLIINLMMLAKNIMLYRKSKIVKEVSRVEEDVEQLGKTKCSICLERVVNATVTQCGHVFCWFCIQRYASKANNAETTCPSCRLAINQDKLILLNNY